MHNRARMIVASFLTKDLYLDWRARRPRTSSTGCVDGEIANNNLNWQWIAGTGTDTNPHRIFNPTVQAQRFDPDGDYVRRYVPELRGGRAAPRCTSRGSSRPRSARALDYPTPIVDHHEAVAEYKATPGRAQCQARSMTARAARRRPAAPPRRPGARCARST